MSGAVLTLLLPALSLTAKDMGLTLDQSGAYEAVGSTGNFLYTGTLFPWFSAPLTSNIDLYISAGATVDYENETLSVLPELLRTELEFRWENAALQVGRMYYADTLGFIVEGLFDGARITADTSWGVWGLGAWYTGLLYKKSAHITITQDELSAYYAKLEYTDFWDTYFAPRRLVAALDWEDPGFWKQASLRFSLIGQFDLTGSEALHHTQYLAGRFNIPAGSFVFDLGGCVELHERSERFQVSFAGELGIGWFLPTKIQDRLMVTGRLSSGSINNDVVAFVPVTTESQGNVLKAKLSGLSMVSLDYTARLHQTLSINISSSYFILSDKITYVGMPGERDGFFLGNEFYGILIWSPVSDLQIKAGGGAFLPSLGNADPHGDVQWRIELGAVLAIF